MSDKFERVAFAIYMQDCQGDPITAWEDLPAETIARYMLNACAAIEALRTPTQTMLEAGSFSYGHGIDTDAVAYIWEAMIEEALK